LITEWQLDAYMQRRAQIGPNKGESHHARGHDRASAARAKSAIGLQKGSTSAWLA